MLACPSLEILNQANMTLSLYWGPDKAMLHCVLQLSVKLLTAHPSLLVLIWEAAEVLAVEASLEEVGHCCFMELQNVVTPKHSLTSSRISHLSMQDMVQTCFLPGQAGSITSFICIDASLTQLSF